MSAEELVKFFDSRWFGQEIETPSPTTPQELNPYLEIEEEPKKLDLSRLPSLHVRSMSDQTLLFISNQDSVSPTSVLVMPKLQTILSGKVMKEDPIIEEDCTRSRSRPRRKKKVSKSLSELELEEVKGFMDLGFVFSEEDKESSLVSIIPGLLRFGSREEENKVVSRPYLSEAWEVMEQRRREKQPLVINWRVADLRNEMNVKDHLKFWAQSVAFAIK